VWNERKRVELACSESSNQWGAGRHRLKKRAPHRPLKGEQKRPGGDLHGESSQKNQDPKKRKVIRWPGNAPKE